MAVYAWGLGKSGQLGNRSTENCELPRLMKIKPRDKKSGVSDACTRKRIDAGARSAGRGASDGVDAGDICTPGGAGDRVDAGALFTAWVHDGKLYTTGCGKYGRLGHGEEEDVSSPTLVTSIPGQVTEASCGSWHACAITSDNKLYSWGYGKSQAVQGEAVLTGGTYTLPSPVLLPGAGTRILGVSAGHNYTLAWDSAGRAFSWGSNHHGVLGQGDVKCRDRSRPAQIQHGDLQEHRAGGGDTGGKSGVCYMSAGHSHAALVTTDGEVYTFGKGKDGALGRGESEVKDSLSPAPITGVVGVVRVSCSVGEHHGHTLAVTGKGEVYSWGDGYKGKLGLGDQEPRYTPTRIPQGYFTPSTNASGDQTTVPRRQETATRISTIIEELSYSGRKYTSSEPQGKASVSSNPSKDPPVEVQPPTGRPENVYPDPNPTPGDNSPIPVPLTGDHITDVSAGGIHSAAVSREGRVYTWGCGSDGRLGHPEARGHRYLFRSDTPRHVEHLQGKALMVKASYYHTVALLVK